MADLARVTPGCFALAGYHYVLALAGNRTAQGEAGVGVALKKSKVAPLVAAGVQANVIHHAGELTKKSTTIRDFVKTGRVKVAAAVYSLETGEVTWLNLTGPKKKP